MLRIAVLVSGGGTNLEALLRYHEEGKNPDGKIVLVLSSNPHAYALTRAKNHGVETAVVNRRDFTNTDAFCTELKKELLRQKIDLIVLAGFMSILNREFTDCFADRILNVHPSLIPSFCGEGFYGLRVHEEALNYGVKVTGATVHFVNEVTDGGKILLQKAVRVYPKDTPEKLQKRVMKQAEWVILPKAVAMVCKERSQKGEGKQ